MRRDAICWMSLLSSIIMATEPICSMINDLTWPTPWHRPVKRSHLVTVQHGLDRGCFSISFCSLFFIRKGHQSGIILISKPGLNIGLLISFSGVINLLTFSRQPAVGVTQHVTTSTLVMFSNFTAQMMVNIYHHLGLFWACYCMFMVF